MKGDKKCILARGTSTISWNQVCKISKKYCGNTHQSREKIWENSYMLSTMKGIRIPWPPWSNRNNYLKGCVDDAKISRLYAIRLNNAINTTPQTTRNVLVKSLAMVEKNLMQIWQMHITFHLLNKTNRLLQRDHCA